MYPIMFTTHTIVTLIYNSCCTNFYNEENQRWLDILWFTSSLYMIYKSWLLCLQIFVGFWKETGRILHFLTTLKSYTVIKITNIRLGLYFPKEIESTSNIQKLGDLKNYEFLVSPTKFQVFTILATFAHELWLPH